MFYNTHQIEEMHTDETVIFEANVYTVYDSNFNIVAVYELTFTANMVINGVHRVK